MMSPEQCRAGRALLGWSQETLGKKAGGFSFQTISRFELERGEKDEAVALGVEYAFRLAGVSFYEDKHIVIIRKEKK